MLRRIHFIVQTLFNVGFLESFLENDIFDDFQHVRANLEVHNHNDEFDDWKSISF